MEEQKAKGWEVKKKRKKRREELICWVSVSQDFPSVNPHFRPLREME